MYGDGDKWLRQAQNTQRQTIVFFLTFRFACDTRAESQAMLHIQNIDFF